MRRPQIAQFLDGFVAWYGAEANRLGGFNVVDLATILFALVRVDRHPPGAFVRHAAKRLVNGGLLADAQLRDLTTVAYCCATLREGPWELLDALAREAQARLRRQEEQGARRGGGGRRPRRCACGAGWQACLALQRGGGASALCPLAPW
jgi:hypothetical protein